ncbi:MAG: hypothetical protein R2911_44995 [Caldilineaceae bacterium]
MLEELLEIMLGGAQGQTTQPQRQPAANPWTEILEGVLGGAPTGAPDSGSKGGPSASSGPGISDILEIVLGGGANSRQKGPIGGNPMLAPFTQALAERLGISPQMASVIISAAFGLLMSQLQGAAQRGQLDARASAAGLDMNQLLNPNVLASSGVTKRVSAQTGMNESDIERALREALEILGVDAGSAPTPAKKPTQPAPATPKPAPKRTGAPRSDLKHLLDTWKIDG